MKNKAVRRHHEFRTRKKLEQNYNSCIQDLSPEERRDLEGKVDKLKKVCASPYSQDTRQKFSKKPPRELRHDITMREELF